MPDIIFGPARLRTDPTATPMSAEEVVQYRAAPPPQCLRCGRFTKRWWLMEAYDGNGTQLYATIDCSRCGRYIESLW